MRNPSLAEKKARDDAFLMDVMVALGCVYACGAETCAEEIVETVGAAGLERVAKAEQDPYLRDLRKTIRFLKASAYKPKEAATHA